MNDFNKRYAAEKEANKSWMESMGGEPIPLGPGSTRPTDYQLNVPCNNYNFSHTDSRNPDLHYCHCGFPILWHHYSDILSKEIKESAKKNEEKDHYQYIKERDGKWVILQKGTGKVLSHHDTREKAIAAFKAMMVHKHGAAMLMVDYPGEARPYAREMPAAAAPSSPPPPPPPNGGCNCRGNIRNIICPVHGHGIDHSHPDNNEPNGKENKFHNFNHNKPSKDWRNNHSNLNSDW